MCAFKDHDDPVETSCSCFPSIFYKDFNSASIESALDISIYCLTGFEELPVGTRSIFAALELKRRTLLAAQQGIFPLLF